MANFRAFAIRGLLSVFFSRAMENLAAEINKEWPGSTTVTDHGWWFSQFSNVPWITEQARSWHNQGKMVVLIGHSFGGTSAILAAQRLNLQDVPVQLLVSLDAAHQYTATVMPNVKRCLCFYQQTPGQLGQGVDNAGRGWTQEQWKQRVTFYKRSDTHIGIADEVFVHGKILEAIRTFATPVA